MNEAPFDLVWTKWRKTYRDRFFERPPARKPTSMSIESREQVDQLERVKVCVQIGPSEWETSFVLVTHEEKAWWAERQKELANPKAYYISLGADDRQRLCKIWDRFEDWVMAREEAVSSGELTVPGEHELSIAILKTINKMKAEVKGLERPTMLCWYMAYKRSYFFSSDSPVVTATIECLIDMLATLELYRECALFTRLRAGEGFDGDPRNIWEEKHGLASGPERKEFAFSQMVHYGFIDAY